jgi:hypothetical protein
MQLLATEAINMLAKLEEKQAAHDPGVVEAVRARLREIEARVREVQAGYSRKDGCFDSICSSALQFDACVSRAVCPKRNSRGALA